MNVKQKDLTILGLVAVISAIFALILSNVIIGTPKKNPIKVPVVQAISSAFPNVQTDPTYQKFLNSQAIDPTQLIQIGGTPITTPPFNGQSQSQ